jgi:hypothetical protein
MAMWPLWFTPASIENDVKKNALPDLTMVLGNTQARGLRMAAFWMQMPSAKVLMPQRATRKTGCRRATRRASSP